MASGILKSGLAVVTIFLIVAYLVFHNFFALAAIAGIVLVMLLFSELRVFSLSILFFLEFFVLTLGYGTNTFIGLRVGYFDIFLLLSSILFLLESFVRRESLRKLFPFALLFSLFLLLVSLSAILNPGYYELSLRNIQFFAIEPALIVFVAYYTIRRISDLENNMIVIAIVSLVLNAIYLKTLVDISGSIAPTEIFDIGEISYSIEGTLFFNKNIFGTVQLLLLPLLIAFALRRGKPVFRIILILSSLSSLLVINSVLSRGVVASLALATMGVLILRSRKKVASLIVILFFALTAYALAEATGTLSLYVKRVQEVDLNRLELIFSSVEIMENKPLFGVGPTEQHFIDAMSEYVRVSRGFVYAHPHNSYLQTATFFGIPALVLLLLLQMLLFFPLWRLPRDHNPIITTALIVSLSAFFLEMLTDYVYYHYNTNHAFWMAAALSIVWTDLLGKRGEEKDLTP